jgi:hypothetical protein
MCISAYNSCLRFTCFVGMAGAKLPRKSNNQQTTTMKLTRLIALIAAGAALALNSAFANGIDYSNNASTSLKLNGNSTFTFTAVAGKNFTVTNDTLAGDALGLQGLISGTYTIGAVTTASGTSSAAVTGAGSFKIFDGINTFSATLQWLDISQTGTGSTLNTTGTANLTGITYAGTKASLIDLMSAASGAANSLTFQFNPAIALSAMKTSKKTTSFSGTVTALPEGGETLVMLGLGLSALAFVRRKRA